MPVAKLSQILKWDLPANQDNGAMPRVKTLRLVALTQTGDLQIIDVDMTTFTGVVTPVVMIST